MCVLALNNHYLLQWNAGATEGNCSPPFGNPSHASEASCRQYIYSYNNCRRFCYHISIPCDWRPLLVTLKEVSAKLLFLKYILILAVIPGEGCTPPWGTVRKSFAVEKDVHLWILWALIGQRNIGNKHKDHMKMAVSKTNPINRKSSYGCLYLKILDFCLDKVKWKE